MAGNSNPFDTVSDIFGGIFGSDAAGQQERAAKQAMGVQGDVYTNSGSNFSPWIQSGQQSLGQLMRMIQSGAFNNNINPQTIANDPGYQFQMQQGQQALSRSAAASGMMNSGAFAKGLDRYSQGLASTDYQQAWQRQFQQNQANFGQLYQLAGMGQNAAAQYGNIGQHYADSMGQLYGAMGNAQAAGTMAWGNAISGATQSLGNNIDQNTPNFQSLEGMGSSAMGAMGGSGGGGGGGAAAGIGMLAAL